MSPVYDALEGNRVIGEADVFALLQFRHMQPQDCQEVQLTPSLPYATACAGHGKSELHDFIYFFFFLQIMTRKWEAESSRKQCSTLSLMQFSPGDLRSAYPPFSAAPNSRGLRKHN